MNERTYENGYKDALELMDFTITHAIKRNDDMATPQQMLNVVNAVIAELNYQIIECNTDDCYGCDENYDEECCCEEEGIELTAEGMNDLLKQVFGIIEGGRNNE